MLQALPATHGPVREFDGLGHRQYINGASKKRRTHRHPLALKNSDPVQLVVSNSAIWRLYLN
jgi:hypothetical protein